MVTRNLRHEIMIAVLLFLFPLLPPPPQGVVFGDYGTDLNSGASVLGDPAGARGKPGRGFGYGRGHPRGHARGPAAPGVRLERQQRAPLPPGHWARLRGMPRGLDACGD